MPHELDVSLVLAGTTASVEVVGHAEDLLERDPTSHTDIDQSLIERLPVDTGSGLNQVITLASPGVVSDSNGFFHPVGDHAQTQFSIDNQPVTDQQSRVYSNQISQDAVQSMEVITGVAPAEYGTRASLAIVTRSGLDQQSRLEPLDDIWLVRQSILRGQRRRRLAYRRRLPLGQRAQDDRFLDPPEFDAARHGSSFVFNRLDAHAGATKPFSQLQGAKTS